MVDIGDISSAIDMKHYHSMVSSMCKSPNVYLDALNNVWVLLFVLGPLFGHYTNIKGGGLSVSVVEIRGSKTRSFPLYCSKFAWNSLNNILD